VSSEYVPKKYTPGDLLRSLHGEEYDKVYNLTQMAKAGKRVLTLGRQTDNSIFIKSMHSTFLSRYHCTLETTKDYSEWIIRDGQWNGMKGVWNPSRNGTFINSHQILGRQVFYLKPGDIITVGDITLRFENY
jgi:pSer/pThr/pTyr-binding forkhead associated (FHA) protein